MKKLKLKKTGEHPGFCRKYYKEVGGGNRLFAHQENYKDVWEWYTCTKEGEPDCHIRKDIEIEIVH